MGTPAPDAPARSLVVRDIHRTLNVTSSLRHEGESLEARLVSWWRVSVDADWGHVGLTTLGHPPGHTSHPARDKSKRERGAEKTAQSSGAE